MPILKLHEKTVSCAEMLAGLWHDYYECQSVLPVWHNRVRRLATDLVVMCSSPAKVIPCALLANQPKQIESVSLFI